MYTFDLTRDDKVVLARVSEFEAIKYIHKNHGYSFDHACRYEGYRLILVNDQPPVQKMVTFDSLLAQYGAYSKDGVDYAITQNPYPDYVAGSSNGYLASGETYYFAQGYDRQGNPFRLIWEITNKETEDESEACDWGVFEAEPSVADSAPWHPDSL